MQTITPVPHAEAAECAVISTIFAEPEIWLPRARAAGIDADSFHAHRRLFEAIIEFYEIHRSLDLTGFIQDTQTAGTFDALGGGAMVETLTYFTGGTRGWSSWIGQLQEARARRIAAHAAHKLAEAECGDDAAQVLADALERISRVKSGPSRTIDAKAATQRFIAEFLQRANNGDLPGKSTGIQLLDVATGGLKPGELWTVGAPTSGGKSVMLLQFAAEILASGGRVAHFSLEMGAAEIVGRLLSCHRRIDHGSITRPRDVSKSEIPRIEAGIQELEEWRLVIDDTGGQTLDHITAEAARVRDELGGLDLVIIDYLQLIPGERGRSESREQEVARLSRSMKALAKNLGCPVATASQLNDDGRLRESRAIGFDSDVVLIVGGDGVKIAKARNAPRGTVLPLKLEGKFQRFVETAYTPEPAGGERSHRRYGA